MAAQRPPSTSPSPAAIAKLQNIVFREIHRFPDLGVQIHTLQVQPTPRPIEDRLAVVGGDTNDGGPLVLGVFDGHRGHWAAEHVAAVLPSRIAALEAPTPHAVAALFTSLDAEMLAAFRASQPSTLQRLFPGRSGVDPEAQRLAVKRVASGCTACMAVLHHGRVRVFNAGDSRAVFATADGLFETADHTASSPAERERIHREHPGKEHVFVGGRLFGQQVALRGFGDAHYKLPVRGHRAAIEHMSAFQGPKSIKMSEMYSALFGDYRSPPYLTATPEVYDLQYCGLGVVASDGLWDLVGSAQAVEILRQWDGMGNAAEFLVSSVVEGGRRPGDDVSVIVVLPLADGEVIGT